MDITQSIALLGRPASDPDIQALLARLKILRQPQLEFDDNDSDLVVNAQDWLLNRGLGVELGFEALAHLNGEIIDEPAIEPMVLSQIYFYVRHENVRRYEGPLPFDINPDDNRKAVRSKLGAYEATRRSYVRDTWEMPECRLTVSYIDEGAAIGYVVCLLRSPAMPTDATDVALLPPLHLIINVMGRPLSDPELRLTFKRLQLEQNLEEEGGSLLADFHVHSGIELHFRHIGGGRDQVLTNVLLYREHELNAARWPGALPHDLLFDDSPDQLLRKVARPPDQHNDTDFVGYALWDFEDYRLQVKYSTFENMILRVQLAAPGASLMA